MRYVIQHRYWDDTDLVAWFDTMEEVEAWVEENPLEEYHHYTVFEPTLHHTLIDVEYYEHEYVPYTGPVIRQRVETPDSGPMYAHRIPIDCIRASPNHKLTVEHPLRIVEVGDPRPDRPFEQCRCPSWVMVEGSSEAVEKYAAAHA